jgi:hypothetical protein
MILIEFFVFAVFWGWVLLLVSVLFVFVFVQKTPEILSEPDRTLIRTKQHCVNITNKNLKT